MVDSTSVDSAGGPTDAPSPAAALADVVDRLLDLDVDALSDDQLLDLARDVETQRRRFAALDAALVAAMDRRDLARRLGCPNPKVLLIHLLRVSPGEARARVLAANDFGPRRSLTGEPLEPVFPEVARAVADGEISVAHARVVSEVIDALPASVETDHGRAVEHMLVEQARTLNPVLLGRAGQRILATLNPGGILTTEADHARRRGLALRVNADGSGELSGHLTSMCVATWQPIFDSLARPAPSEDGTPDPRSFAQRLHDALLDGGQRLLRTGELPECAGVPVTILLSMTLDQLESRTGLAFTGHGAPMSVEAALKHAAQAQLVPVVFGRAREIVAYAGPHRLARPADRLALAARDGGCSFPGCDLPAAWTQAHHVPDYTSTGHTRVDELTLLCGFHHREHPNLGWSCEMTDGLPYWIPPPWIDRDQRPRRNHMHDQARL